MTKRDNLYQTQSFINPKGVILFAGISLCNISHATIVNNLTVSDSNIHIAAIKENNENHIKKFLNQVKNNAINSGIEVPNDWAVDTAKSVVTHLYSKIPEIDFINPSHEGGIVIEYHIEEHYFLIEIYNDYDIVFLKRKGGTREVFDTDIDGIFELI